MGYYRGQRSTAGFRFPSQTIFLRSSNIFCSRERLPCQVARTHPTRRPDISPTKVPLRSQAPGQKFRATHCCMYRLFWYWSVRATMSASITIDSPRASRIARLAVCSALRRCKSNRSDIEQKWWPPSHYKMSRSFASNADYIQRRNRSHSRRSKVIAGICEIGTSLGLNARPFLAGFTCLEYALAISGYPSDRLVGL